MTRDRSYAFDALVMGVHFSEGVSSLNSPNSTIFFYFMTITHDYFWISLIKFLAPSLFLTRASVHLSSCVWNDNLHDLVIYQLNFSLRYEACCLTCSSKAVRTISKRIILFYMKNTLLKRWKKITTCITYRI